MVYNGIDTIDKHEKLFAKKRLGLITSISGTDRYLTSSIEILHKKFGLKALFSPEHGVRGNMGAGDYVETYQDPYTNIPVYSLYREDSKRFTEEMLSHVDAVIFDIQDLGIRYYTFISTMIYALEDCAKYGKELIILDRLNPLGDKVEGNCMKEPFESFIGAYTICMRYGLTVGELAQMVNKEKKIGCDLTVIPIENWNRNNLFPETGNVWVMPSLGMPRFDTAVLYTGMCLFEGTNLSEGRGTTAPFEIIGADFIDSVKLVEAMTAKNLPGVLFSTAYFNPSFSKFQGKQCEGIHAHITDYRAYQSARTGLELLFTIREMYGDKFEFLPPIKEGSRSSIELLFGSDEIKTASLEQLLGTFEKDEKQFRERKKEYINY